MSKALDMMTSAMKQAAHEIACANNTASQLREQKEALKNALALMQSERDVADAYIADLKAELDRANFLGRTTYDQLHKAQDENAALRKQVDALSPSSKPAPAGANVYGGGAGDLDTRDNGMVTHGDFAE